MAVQITYTIPPQGVFNGNSVISGSIVDVTFTLSPTQNLDGSYTVIGATGTFETTQETAGVINVTGTDTITGVGHGLNNSGGASDNELFLVMDPDTMPIVTAGGADFTISNAKDTNNAGGNIDFYDNNGGAAGTVPTDKPNYMQGGTGNVTPAEDVTETNDSAVCFTTGTLIRTAAGDVPVEHLFVGDCAVSASGGERCICWISSRTIESPAPDACPIRIKEGAFGSGLPERDLLLSPGHPVLVGADEDGAGGHLVPIMCLVNGTSIERVAVDEVTYWHVELDQHDILLAEGLPAESYIDLGSRPWFEGADGALYDPDLALPGQPGRCRPVAVEGPVVEAERRRLDRIFATQLAAAAGWPDVQNALLALF